jgi:hypothetical protein
MDLVEESLKKLQTKTTGSEPMASNRGRSQGSPWTVAAVEEEEQEQEQEQDDGEEELLLKLWLIISPTSFLRSYIY